MIGVLIIFISFILDIVFSLYTNSFIINWYALIPLFTITGIIYAYKYLESDLKVYFISVLIIGLIMDNAITNTGVLNTLLFLGISFITAVVASFFKPLYLVNIGLVVVNITIYLLLSYLILGMYNVYLFNFITLIKGIVGSYLINIIYLSIITYISYRITKKQKRRSKFKF